MLDSVNLAVRHGERLALMGSSGSGKTSLLRVMAGLDRPAAGEVTVGGEPVSRRRREVTMTFSQDTIYDHLDVEGNLDFPFRVTEDAPDRRQRVVATADQFSLHRLMDRRPSSLSAGQRQAVATARALVRPGVEVVLMDEPLAGTDPHRRQVLVEAVMARPDLTVVLATNDPADAFRWCDRVAVLARGTVAQTGAPRTVHRDPSSLAVAELTGELNRVPATVRAGAPWALEVGGSTLTLDPVPAGLVDGQRVVLGLRPYDISLASSATPFERRLRATIGRVEPLGGGLRVLFGLGDRGGTGFVAEVATSPGVGDRVDWFVPTDALALYDPATGRRL